MSWKSAFVSLVLGGLFCPSYAEELIVNGDFEADGHAGTKDGVLAPVKGWHCGTMDQVLCDASNDLIPGAPNTVVRLRPGTSMHQQFNAVWGMSDTFVVSLNACEVAWKGSVAGNEVWVSLQSASGEEYCKGVANLDGTHNGSTYSEWTENQTFHFTYTGAELMAAGAVPSQALMFNIDSKPGRHSVNWIDNVSVQLVRKEGSGGVHVVAADSASVFSATVLNTTLINNGVNDDSEFALAEIRGGALQMVNKNGAFNTGGMVSSKNISMLLGRPLTDRDVVTMKFKVQKITGRIRSKGVLFGMVGSAVVWPETTMNNLLVAAQCEDLGSNVVQLSSLQDNGDTGHDTSIAALQDGFSMTLVADVHGYSFKLEGVGETDPIVMSGGFSGSEFRDYFGAGYFFCAVQKFKKKNAVTCIIEEASIEVGRSAQSGSVIFIGGP
jgi:hypothetical protein